MKKYLILLVLLSILFIIFYRNNEIFNNYHSNSVYDAPAPAPAWNDNAYFKYLNNNSILGIDSTKYENLNLVPKLIFESYDSCPNLYTLFHNIKLRDQNNHLIRGEGTEGINFRNTCERIFYNSSFFIRIEHPIIEIEGKEVDNKKQEFEFQTGYGLDVIKYNFTEMDPNNESYAPGYSCSIDKKIKQINFQVKADFTLPDIYKFLDYCYTQLCYGMIYIEHMRLVGNQYRVLPCPRHKGEFFILPERIRYQVAKEGKYYTRAKCNRCCLNIIVLFGERFPEKFDYIYEDRAPSECVINQNQDFEIPEDIFV